MWSRVASEGGSPTTEWVFDIECYVWDDDMLVYEEDLEQGYEMELVEYVM